MAETAKLRQLMAELRQEENALANLNDAARAARRRRDYDAEEKATRAARNQVHRISGLQAEIEDERQRSGPAGE